MISDLRLVEIELFSYCNRKCAWCPNSFIDRYTDCIYMEDDILISILKSINNMDNKPAITFSRFNEPMSKIDIFKEKLIFIKNMLPDNKLITNTNGDFINKENLENLMLDELTIMDYDNIGLTECVTRLIDAGAIIDKISFPYVYAHTDKIQILYYVNYTKYGKITDRGGTLPLYIVGQKRDTQCVEPLRFVGINYDGTVSPCCNIRNDIDSTKGYIMGDLHNNTLEEILNSDKYITFKNNCLNGIFDDNSPCQYCSNSGGRYSSGKGGISYE